MIPSARLPRHGAFQNILSSEVSALLVIDHQTAFADCFETASVIAAEQVLKILLETASKLHIPTIASVVETNRISAGTSPLIKSALGRVNCFGRSVANPWDAVEFSDAVQTANRSKLIIAGLSAESSLSMTALCALEQGFDVYVVRDACLGYTAETLEANFERLKQAGAVIVSWRQVIMEWNQGSVDSGFLRRVMKPNRASSESPEIPDALT